ncbi:MAG TPA: hypothetical protein VIX35_02375 [Vicinamibacterales bacterium]
MTHLTSEQFIDAIEAKVALPRAASAHLAGCDACRTEQSSVADALAEARALAMPEPSPLFWDHFSQRVRAATNEEQLPVATPASWAAGWRAVLAGALVVGVLTVAFVLRPAPVKQAAPINQLTVAQSGDAMTGDDHGLTGMAILASDLKTDELQQIARPSEDATAAAIEDLTPAQRAELLRLIKQQTGGAE